MNERTKRDTNAATSDREQTASALLVGDRAAPTLLSAADTTTATARTAKAIRKLRMRTLYAAGETPTKRGGAHFREHELKPLPPDVSVAATFAPQQQRISPKVRRRERRAP